MFHVSEALQEGRISKHQALHLLLAETNNCLKLSFDICTIFPELDTEAINILKQKQFIEKTIKQWINSLPKSPKEAFKKGEGIKTRPAMSLIKNPQLFDLQGYIKNNIDNPDPKIRQLIIVLARLGAQETFPEVSKILIDDNDSLVRFTVYQQLSSLSVDPEQTDTIISKILANYFLELDSFILRVYDLCLRRILCEENIERVLTAIHQRLPDAQDNTTQMRYFVRLFRSISRKNWENLKTQEGTFTVSAAQSGILEFLRNEQQREQFPEKYHASLCDFITEWAWYFTVFPHKNNFDWDSLWDRLIQLYDNPTVERSSILELLMTTRETEFIPQDNPRNKQFFDLPYHEEDVSALRGSAFEAYCECHKNKPDPELKFKHHLLKSFSKLNWSQKSDVILICKEDSLLRAVGQAILADLQDEVIYETLLEDRKEGYYFFIEREAKIIILFIKSFDIPEELYEYLVPIFKMITLAHRVEASEILYLLIKIVGNFIKPVLASDDMKCLMSDFEDTQVLEKLGINIPELAQYSGPYTTRLKLEKIELETLLGLDPCDVNATETRYIALLLKPHCDSLSTRFDCLVEWLQKASQTESTKVYVTAEFTQVQDGILLSKLLEINLPAIRKFEIDWSSLPGAIPDESVILSWANVIPKLEALEAFTLIFKDSEVSGEVLRPLIQAICENRSLTHVSFDVGGITEDQCKCYLEILEASNNPVLSNICFSTIYACPPGWYLVLEFNAAHSHMNRLFKFYAKRASTKSAVPTQ